MVEASKRRVPRWVIGLALVPVLGVACLVAAMLQLPKWLLSQVIAEAQARGIELSDCALDYRLKGLFDVEQISLSGCKVAATQPVAATGSVRRIVIELAQRKPTSLNIEAPQLRVVGTPDWQTLGGQGGDLPPYTVSGGQAEWFVDADAATATATLSNLSHTPADDQWSTNVNLLGIAQGSALLGTKIEVELALLKEPKTRLRIDIDTLSSYAEVKLEFDDFAVAELEGIALNRIPAELADVTVNGDFKFELPYGLNPKLPGGSFRADLRGLNFPVPRELAGLIYAPKATLDGKFKTDRSFTKFTISPLNFQTGQLAMKGRSEVTLEGIRAHITSQLSGPLSCSAIVSSAAHVHLNTEVAKVAANIARRALRGSVDIFVLLDADTQDLSAAKVVQGVGLGCGIQRIPLPELKSFPAQVLQRLPVLRQLPELVGALDGPAPKLPSLDTDDLKLPSLSDLPKFELPRLKRLDDETAPAP